jgi:transcriptional regulator with XRE-family HTH domain
MKMMKRTPDQLIGARLREARLEQGLTMEAIAAELGILLNAVSKKERGLDRLSAVQLAKVARMLHRDPGWFLEGIR